MSTLGYTTQGGSSENLIGFQYGNGFTATENGTVTQINVYSVLTQASGATSLKLGIFSDSSGSPGSKLAEATVTVNSTSVALYSASISLSITAGTKYWLIALPQSSSSTIRNVFDSLSDTMYYKSATYPTFVDPFGTPTGSFTQTQSLYVTYAPSILPLSVSDTTVISENLPIVAGAGIVLNETTIVSENVKIFIPIFNINISETTTIGEYIILKGVPSIPRVRFAYMIASDETFDPNLYQGIYTQVKMVRDFYGNQLGAGFTFGHYIPLVEILYSSQTSSWFTTNGGQGTAADNVHFNASNQYPILSSTPGSDKVVIFPSVIYDSSFPLGNSIIGGSYSVVFPTFFNDWGNSGSVAAHELGHLFGLDHTADGSIMDGSGGSGGGPLNPILSYASRLDNNGNPTGNPYFTAFGLTQLNGSFLRGNSFFQDPFALTIFILERTDITESTNTIPLNSGQIFIQETVVMSERVIFPTIGINISDTTVVTDNGIDGPASTIMIRSFLNVSDVTPLTEIVNLFSTFYPLITDTTVMSEAVTLNVSVGISKTETTNISENVALSMQSYINKSDTTAITEIVTESITSFMNVSENTSVTENINVFITVLFILVSDTTTVNDVVTFTGSRSAFLSDTTTLSESITMFQNMIPPGTADITVVSDSVSLNVNLGFSVSDITVVNDSGGISITVFDIPSVFDTTVVSEKVSILVVSFLNVSDNTVLGDLPIFVPFVAHNIAYSNKVVYSKDLTPYRIRRK